MLFIRYASAVGVFHFLEIFCEHIANDYLRLRLPNPYSFATSTKSPLMSPASCRNCDGL